MSRPPLHRWRTTLALAAMPLALLVGCSDDAPTPVMPDETSAAPTSPTETTPSEPVEPTPPPILEENSAEAAAAFVEYYYAHVNHAQSTGQTKSLRRLAAPSCAACEGGVMTIEEIYDSGGASTGGDHDVVDVEVTGREAAGPVTLYYLDVTAHHGAQTISGAGELNGEYEAGTSKLRYQVAYSSNGWRIADWRVS